ncbi:head-tail connector protein [Parabacteroides sp. OttesenSCG-928-J18]|nr:head-tail connector protein [Parabacteroides sp. OttesenSCG-928-J18]
MNLININELKHNLNIECDFHDEDIYLKQLIDVATEAVFNYLNKSIDDFRNYIPETIRFAIIILASQYYENRTSIAFSNVVEIPYTFQFLLSPYKNITVV